MYPGYGGLFLMLLRRHWHTGQIHTIIPRRLNRLEGTMSQERQLASASTASARSRSSSWCSVYSTVYTPQQQQQKI